MELLYPVDVFKSDFEEFLHGKNVPKDAKVFFKLPGMKLEHKVDTFVYDLDNGSWTFFCFGKKNIIINNRYMDAPATKKLLEKLNKWVNEPITVDTFLNIFNGLPSHDGISAFCIDCSDYACPHADFQKFVFDYHPDPSTPSITISFANKNGTVITDWRGVFGYGYMKPIIPFMDNKETDPDEIKYSFDLLTDMENYNVDVYRILQAAKSLMDNHKNGIHSNYAVIHIPLISRPKYRYLLKALDHNETLVKLFGEKHKLDISIEGNNGKLYAAIHDLG